MIKKDNITECNIANLDHNKNYENFLNSIDLTEPTDKTMENRLIFLALNANKISSFFNLCQTSKGKDTPAACENLIISLNKNLFNPLNYFNANAHDGNYFFTALGNYNDLFNLFDEKYRTNPFKIQTEDFDKYLKSSSISSTPQYQISVIEDYLKTMFLSNRTAKLFEKFNDCNLQETINNSDKNFEKNRENLQKVCKQVYSRLSDLDILGKYSKSDLINLFNKYYNKEITNEELKNSPIYLDFLNTIQKAKTEVLSKTNSNFTSNDICITPETLYKHYSFEKVINRAYSLKEKMWKRTYAIYANAIKSKNGDKFEEEKIKSIIRITSYTDKIKNNRFDTTLCFIPKGYNIPFQIHVNSSSLESVIKKHGVQIETGKIKVPFKPILPYKYNPKQIKMIQNYIDVNKYSFNRASNECKIMKYTEQMLDNIGDISLSTPTISHPHVR